MSIRDCSEQLKNPALGRGAPTSSIRGAQADAGGNKVCLRAFLFQAFGFSLIELLVVMAILSILVTLGVSTLANPKQGVEVAQAGGTLGDLASLARQHALSKNTRTVLVVAQITGVRL